MSGRGAELGIQPDELIERGTGRARIPLAELRLRQSEHEVRVVFVQPAEGLPVLGDGLIVALVAHQFLRVALAAGDVASDAGLVLVAAPFARPGARPAG